MTGLWGRLVCLVLVPVCCGFGPWFLFALVADGSRDWFGSADFLVVAVVPLSGLLAVLGYRLFGATRSRVWPYLPYAVAASGFVVASAAPDDFVSTDSGLIVWFGCLAVQPFLALLGGFIGFIAIGNRYAGLAD